MRLELQCSQRPAAVEAQAVPEPAGYVQSGTAAAVALRWYRRDVMPSCALVQDPQSQSDEKSNVDATTHSNADVAHKFERLVVGDKLVLREGDITSDQWQVPRLCGATQRTEKNLICGCILCRRCLSFWNRALISRACDCKGWKSQGRMWTSWAKA